MTFNASLVQQQIDYRWTEEIVHSSIDEDMNTNADIAWNIGRCSFVTTTVPVSLIQHFNIPKYYQHTIRPSYSWHMAMFCGILSNIDIKIFLVLDERNNHNESLQTYQLGELNET